MSIACDVMFLCLLLLWCSAQTSPECSPLTSPFQVGSLSTQPSSLLCLSSFYYDVVSVSVPPGKQLTAGVEAAQFQPYVEYKTGGACPGDTFPYCASTSFSYFNPELTPTTVYIFVGSVGTDLDARNYTLSWAVREVETASCSGKPVGENCTLYFPPSIGHCDLYGMCSLSCDVQPCVVGLHCQPDGVCASSCGPGDPCLLSSSVNGLVHDGVCAGITPEGVDYSCREPCATVADCETPRSACVNSSCVPACNPLGDGDHLIEINDDDYEFLYFSVVVPAFHTLRTHITATTRCSPSFLIREGGTCPGDYAAVYSATTPSDYVNSLGAPRTVFIEVAAYERGKDTLSIRFLPYNSVCSGASLAHGDSCNGGAGVCDGDHCVPLCSVNSCLPDYTVCQPGGQCDFTSCYDGTPCALEVYGEGRFVEGQCATVFGELQCVEACNATVSCTVDPAGHKCSGGACVPGCEAPCEYYHLLEGAIRVSDVCDTSEGYADLYRCAPNCTSTLDCAEATLMSDMYCVDGMCQPPSDTVPDGTTCYWIGNYENVTIREGFMEAGSCVPFCIFDPTICGEFEFCNPDTMRCTPGCLDPCTYLEPPFLYGDDRVPGVCGILNAEEPFELCMKPCTDMLDCVENPRFDTADGRWECIEGLCQPAACIPSSSVCPFWTGEAAVLSTCVNEACLDPCTRCSGYGNICNLTTGECELGTCQAPCEIEVVGGASTLGSCTPAILGYSLCVPECVSKQDCILETLLRYVEAGALAVSTVPENATLLDFGVAHLTIACNSGDCVHTCTDPLCTDCLSLTTGCAACTPPKLVEEGACVSECSPGYSPGVTACTACSVTYCEVCEDVDVCDACVTPLLLYNGQCVVTCPSSHYAQDGVCYPCLENVLCERDLSCTGDNRAGEACEDCAVHAWDNAGVCTACEDQAGCTFSLPSCLPGLSYLACAVAQEGKQIQSNGTVLDAGCPDGFKNQQETDVDCGTTACGRCAVGKTCTFADNCESGVCVDGLCTAECSVPAPPANANRGTCGTRAPVGQQCTYNCTNGFSLTQVSDPVLTCEYDAALTPTTYNLRGSQACICVGQVSSNVTASGELICEPCPAGKSFTEDVCKPCGRGLYQDEVGQPVCKACPEADRRDTALEGSASVLACNCKETFFAGPQRVGGLLECLECPIGGACAGFGQVPMALEGYYDRTGSKNFELCNPPDVCTGFNECREGHDGPFCGNCVDGYYMLNGLCEKCPDVRAEWLVPVGILVGIAAAFIMAWIAEPLVDVPGQPSPIPMVSLGLGVTFAQTTAILADMEIAWTPKVRFLFQWFSVLNVNIEIASPECQVKLSFFDKWAIMMAFPLVMIVFFCIVFLAAFAWKKYKKKSEPVKKSAHIALAGYLLSLTLSYIGLVTTTLHFFACKESPDGGYFLRSNKTIQCYVGEWNSHLWIGVLGLIIYVVGVPFILAAVLIVIQTRHSRKEVLSHQLTSFMAKKFETKFVFWGTVILARKFLLAFAIAMMDDFVQYTFCFLVQFFSVVVLGAARPYREDSHDVLEFCLIMCHSLLLFAGPLLNNNGSQEQADARYVISDVIIVIVGLAMLCVLVCACHEIRVNFKLFLESRKRKQIEDEENEDDLVGMDSSNSSEIYFGKFDNHMQDLKQKASEKLGIERQPRRVKWTERLVQEAIAVGALDGDDEEMVENFRAMAGTESVPHLRNNAIAFARINRLKTSGQLTGAHGVTLEEYTLGEDEHTVSSRNGFSFADTEGDQYAEVSDEDNEGESPSWSESDATSEVSADDGVDFGATLPKSSSDVVFTSDS